MKFIFFGTPRFAGFFLDYIIEKKIIPSLIFTNPDSVSGRKKIIVPSPVKCIAKKYNIPLLQPKKLEEEMIEEYDFGVVAAYNKLIPSIFIKKCKKGIIGIHPSLLPHLRGPSPIQNSLLRGDKKTGVSLFLIDKLIDHGPLLTQETIQIEDREEYLSLEKKLALLGGKIFVEKIQDYLSGIITPIPQNESLATYTKKISREDAFIEEKELIDAIQGINAKKIAQKIKALNPEPGTWTKKNDKIIKIIDAVLIEKKLYIKKIQYAGKKIQEVNFKTSPFLISKA